MLAGLLQIFAIERTVERHLTLAAATQRTDLAFDGGTEVEIRPVFEADDFGKEFTPELRAQEERLRAQIGGTR